MYWASQSHISLPWIPEQRLSFLCSFLPQSPACYSDPAALCLLLISLVFLPYPHSGSALPHPLFQLFLAFQCPASWLTGGHPVHLITLDSSSASSTHSLLSFSTLKYALNCARRLLLCFLTAQTWIIHRNCINYSSAWPTAWAYFYLLVYIKLTCFY